VCWIFILLGHICFPFFLWPLNCHLAANTSNDVLYYVLVNSFSISMNIVKPS
jgi:hypothetical protein